MLGAIIGDIIGSAYEFDATNNYSFTMFREGSSYTDDTICTIAVADAILKNASYGESLHSWCRRHISPKGGYGSRFLGWVRSDNPKPYGSFGNGSAMRVSPIAWAFPDTGEAMREAQLSAECSHSHPEGIKGAQAVVMAMHILRDIRKRGGIAGQQDLERAFTPLLEMTGYDIRIDRKAVLNRFDETCQGTVPVALWIITESSSFEDAIRRAVSLGADADTLGAITGAMAEALWGIPEPLAAKALEYLTDGMRAVLDRFYHRYLGTSCPGLGGWYQGTEGHPCQGCMYSDGIRCQDGTMHACGRLSAHTFRNRYESASCEFRKTDIGIPSLFETRRVQETIIMEKEKARQLERKRAELEREICNTRPFLSTSIAGTQHVPENLFYRFSEMDMLSVGFEDNPYDDHAVAVYFRDDKVGYIPRKDNHALAEMLMAGWDSIFFAYVRKWSGCGRKRNIEIEVRVRFLPNMDYEAETQNELLHVAATISSASIWRTTPERISSLGENEIFVFGSNGSGQHIGGAAAAAARLFGAIWGQGDGLQGRSYAISTMEGIESMARNINRFIDFAKENPDLTFLVTQIGCGIAGYSPIQVAPLFSRAIAYPNIHLPKVFWEYFLITHDATSGIIPKPSL